MNKTKEEKGISLVSLALAITLMLVISGMILYNSSNHAKVKRLSNMQNDIRNLSNKVEVFYNKYRTLPILSKEYSTASSIPDKNPNESASTKYYVINLELLEGLRLNYGREFEEAKSSSAIWNFRDVYIISEDTHTIYYPKGVTIDGVTYYTDNTKYAYLEGVEVGGPEEPEKPTDPENPEDPDVDDLKALEKYFMGKDITTLVADANATVTSWTFLNDPKSITDASSSIEIIDGVMKNYYIKYNDKAYAVTTKNNVAEAVAFKYAQSGREGTTYEYDSNNDGVKEFWRIIYDYGEGKGIEIISPEIKGDKLTIGGTTANDTITSYNNAVKVINDYCKTVITNPNTPKENIRSFGSDPKNPYNENTTLYTSNNLQSWQSGAYNGKLKSTDYNYEQDWIRMKMLNLTNSIFKYYWTTSRYVDETSSGTDFKMLFFAFNRIASGSMLNVNSSAVQPGSTSQYVRPIVKIPNV